MMSQETLFFDLGKIIPKYARFHPVLTKNEKKSKLTFGIFNLRNNYCCHDTKIGDINNTAVPFNK